MTKVVIVFNSAPNSGKDVAAKFLRDYFRTGQIMSFKDALYEDVSDYFGISSEALIKQHGNRQLKELPSAMFPKFKYFSFKRYFFSYLAMLGVMFNNKYLMELGYYSSRKALIHVSESVIKPVKGLGYYGNILAEKIEKSEGRYFFISDGGYKEEILPILDKGFLTCIVQLERSGATFDGDSRSLLNKDDFKEYNNIKFCQIDNNGSLDDLYNYIVDLSYDIVLDEVKERYGGDKDDYQIIHI